ncbi:MAG: protein translocase subunit SecD [Clostridiales bacterium]|nr:protein translocase subunit SecD [Clostridiales bacterium]
MKVKSALLFLALICAAAGLSVVSYMGIGPSNILGVANIKQGLDLKGGVNIVFEAEAENPTDHEMDSAIRLLQQRLDFKGETESEVSRQGAKRIRVDIPGYEDADEAVQTIGQTARLAFLDEENNELLDGSMVADARKSTQQNAYGASEVVVALEFNSDGAAKFEEATGANIGKSISIMLDNIIISAPTVNARISGGNAVIEGGFTAKEAEDLANLIKSGSLPFDLKVTSMQNVGARLGADALRTSLLGGAIAFGLILLFMLVLYRTSGLAADIALFIYLALNLIILSLFRITLTLPGIAGIALAVGMAVDANIIIFERLKDELSAGKGLLPSINAGFKRAFPAIADSNITTIIAAVILFALGSGPIKGFAQTLIIGIAVSFFTAIFITRLILKSLIGVGASNPKLYGAK